MERHHSSWYVDLLETVILGAKGHLAFINAFDLRQAGGGPTMVSLRLSLVSQLYAFFYVPNPTFEQSNGWNLYSPREEFARMGVGTRSKAWRFTDINKDYTVSGTFISLFPYSESAPSFVPHIPHDL